MKFYLLFLYNTYLIFVQNKKLLLKHICAFKYLIPSVIRLNLIYISIV